ncbi:MAG: hypothetical protein IK065_03350 [Neisseriaceae bacterium]|nr:hypothetical protein [Neisseriaceae bacterium]
MKKKIFLGLLVILSLLCGAWYLGLFDPEWKKYSLESPYVDEHGHKVSKKSDYTKINHFYEKMNIKGLIYDYSIKERIIEEGGAVSNESPILLCSVQAYSLNEQKENNILDYLNNLHIESDDLKDLSYRSMNNYLSKTQSQFHIKGEVTDKSDYHKRIIKKTYIYSNWIPANIMFAINAENIFDKIDENGFVIDKTTVNYPNQWKQLELCLQDMERKNGREFDKISIYIKDGKPLYIVNEQILSKYNKRLLKEKIKNTISSDRSFVKIDDDITCHYNYDAQDFLNKYSNYYKEYNYKKYSKIFVMYQGSFIDIYNIDEKIYIRVFAEYDNGLPYIKQYCEE